MHNKERDLSIYRIEEAKSTLRIAQMCFEAAAYRDSINRSYYAAFYAVKAVLALEGKDFKRHKDAVAYFNQTYIATELFQRDMGRKLGQLKTARETSDYDDFFIASISDAKEQLESATMIVGAIDAYVKIQCEL